MSSYLVTGGAGFIGSHLANRLINLGHKVTILDDLSSGKKSNVNQSANFIQGSITDTSALEAAFKDIDFCYHLAAIASVQESIEKWSECNRINLGGSINIFEMASRKNIPVIYASSAAVYGNPESLPIKEDSIILPLSPYGFDKYSVEEHAKLFTHLKGLQTIGLRLFNVYGSGQDPNSQYSGVISIFIDKILNNEKPQIYGDGSGERDFIYIDDVIGALLAASGAITLYNGQVFNVCTGTGVSINRLISIIYKILNKEPAVDYLSVKTGDIYKSVGSPAKLQSLLGFKANIDIETGLKDLLDSF
jgi:UDP-glucose 4-epimerase